MPQDRKGRAPQERPGREPGGRTLRAGEAAALIGVSVATVRGWADAGRLPSHRTVGGHRRFRVDELRDWLEQRGDQLPGPPAEREEGAEMPPAPALARALNARLEEIVDRVLAGYDDAVPTPLPRPSEPALRRLATRLVRMLTAAVDAGRPGVLAGRVTLAGVRAAAEGPTGVRILLDHVRVAMAVTREAEEALAAGEVEEEEHALACLHAAIDHALAAVAEGLEERNSADPPR